MENALHTRVIDFLTERRERILSGKINCIPSPFVRFSDDFSGIEQDTYFCITSFTKGAKSQFTSYTFIFKPLLKAYYSKDKEGSLDLKILYFPLEETPERILQRFMSFLLFEFDGIRVSPKELRSTTSAVPLNILQLLQTPKYQDIISFFEEHVIFSTEANPTGIMKFCKHYAEEHGTTHTKKVLVKDGDEFIEREMFDYYVQDNPNEYRLIIIDTINLIDTERGMTLKQSMDKLSEYCAKYLRNRYHYSPVVIQQQAFESEGNEAFKLGRMRPSVYGLGDSKYVSRDANVVLGLFSPMRSGLTEYEGYDIKKLKDNVRFLEVIVNRDGGMGGMIALFFDGACCQFKELPKPQWKTEMEKVYKYVEELRKPKEKSIIMFIKALFKRK